MAAMKATRVHNCHSSEPGVREVHGGSTENGTRVASADDHLPIGYDY